MNYQFLIVIMFIISVSPVKGVTDGSQLLEILNISMTGNLGSTAKLCNYLQSRIGEESDVKDVSFTICIFQQLNSSYTKELIRKSKTITYNKYNCIRTILNQLSINESVIVDVYSQSQFQKTVFITFRLDDFDSEILSSTVGINVIKTSMISETIQMSLAVNVTTLVILVYRSICGTNYYGADCDIHCDDISGHYNCDDSGRPQCLVGWQGLFCTEAICDYCVNGQCLAPNTCKCYRGWTGESCTSCQKSIDCKHGTCNNESRLPFSCMCERGWGGQYCDVDLKLCIAQKRLCENNGTCYNYYGNRQMRYICKCSPGFYGRNCKIKSGECDYSICNTENCPKKAFSYKCKCYFGYSGSRCQINNSLQLELSFKMKNLKSDGLCVNAEEGYHCSCSFSPRQMCQCQFIQCPRNTTCKLVNKSRVSCLAKHIGNSSLWQQFSSNFYVFDQSTPADIVQPSAPVVPSTVHPHLRFYLGSLILIPVLMAILILVVIIFRFRCRKKSKICIKTIHNDLQLGMNHAINSIPYKDERLLLNNAPTYPSLRTEISLNSNIFLVQDHGYSTKNDKEIDSNISNLENINKSTFYKTTNNSNICNRNLLISNHKDACDNIK